MRQSLTGAGCALAAMFLAIFFTQPAGGQVMGVIRKIDPPRQGFFSKEIVVRGIRILAHADVSDAAVDEAARRLDRQLSRCPEIAANMAVQGAEMHVIGKDQQVSDLPEHRHLKGKPFDGAKTVDERARGLGACWRRAARRTCSRCPATAGRIIATSASTSSPTASFRTASRATFATRSRPNARSPWPPENGRGRTPAPTTRSSSRN